ncbi:MAG: YfiR family protein [Deltaproteobacteria bacterium]|nr:YfiR family protein [Deltaproteobacteria bacterium]
MSLLVLGPLLFLALLASSPACAQTPEYDVKAAFLYNFARFVEWPENSFPDQNSPIVLCIIGDDSFGDALEPIMEKGVAGRKLVIRRSSGVENVKGCHMAFISVSEKGRLPEMLNAFKDSSILTVSDIERFARRGGMIGFITIGNKIRFEINTDAAGLSNLRISSKLLRLATDVLNSKEGR